MEPRRQFGDVATPPSLVHEMVDATAEFGGVCWSDPGLKFLDPCAGNGCFPLALCARLMSGLAHSIVDEGERRRHILENMLFLVEINPAHACRLRREDMGFKNLLCADFLLATTKQQMLREWGIDAFDVIIGNPPFNGGRFSLWQMFVQEAILSYLKPEGILTFVHPAGWRKPDIGNGLGESTLTMTTPARGKNDGRP